jgi:hypothetical protein
MQNYLLFIYVIALLLVITCGSVTFGCVIHNTILFNPFYTPVFNGFVDYSSIVSVSGAITSLWIAVAMFFVYIITAGLVAVSEDVVRMLFMIIGGFILFATNIALLVYGILIFTNYTETNNYFMNRSIQIGALATGCTNIVSFIVFVIGLVGLVAGSKKYSLFILA